MEIRGHRECTACGTRWSYYETGTITCPSCGSPRSTSLDEPVEHTAGTVTLDLTPVREQIDDHPLREVADAAVDATREFLGSVGFVQAGELQSLTDTYLATAELRRVASTYGRQMQPTDAETEYFLTLLRGADAGDRPAPDAVPESFHPERGLAIAASLDVYQSDIRRVRDDDPAVRRVSSNVRTRRKRIQALDGEVPPAEAEQLVRAVRDLSAYVRSGNETALARARERID